jgi:hypothetical protein
MLLDKPRNLGCRLDRRNLARINNYMRPTFLLAQIERQQGSTRQRPIEQDRRALTINHILPRPFLIAAIHQWRKRIPRRNPPILGSPIRRTPPTTRKPRR